MGTLNDDMSRLCREIVVMRRIRGAFMEMLQCETRDRRIAVCDLREKFLSARANMARKAKADRSAFISNLRRVVGGMRREFHSDLSGARQAWVGKDERRTAR